MKTKLEGIDYFKLLKRIEAEIVFIGERAGEGKFLAIRHDVDHSIEHAFDFAEQEHGKGIFSTYFLLDTEEYFDYTAKFAKQCHKFIELGHRLGWHNNVLAQHIKTGTDPHELIAKPLKFLSDNGIEIKGSSSHGDSIFYNTHTTNYFIWNFIPMKDYGLEWEAYFLPRDCYLSDSGAKWQGGLEKTSTFEKGNEGDIQNAYKIIDNFNALPEGLMQLLVHPCWWEK